MAQIGAIEAVEASGYTIVSIAGSSIGALIGGVYATGKLPEFKEWICNLDKIDVFSLMDFTLSRNGFIKGDRVFNAIQNIVPDCQIEDLKIPFRCTAVEIPLGKEKIFSKGSLYGAIRASVSIPTVLTPAQFNGKSYIDGGILNPIPFSLLSKKANGELVVAIDLNGPKETFVHPEKPVKTDEVGHLLKLPIWVADYRDKFSKYISSDEKKAVQPKQMGSIELLNHSFDLLQDRLSAFVIKKHKMDMLIEISRMQAGTLEFYRAAELIEIGRNKALKAIEKFENGNQQA
jgi:NTE family protein